MAQLDVHGGSVDFTGFSLTQTEFLYLGIEDKYLQTLLGNLAKNFILVASTKLRIPDFCQPYHFLANFS